MWVECRLASASRRTARLNATNANVLTWRYERLRAVSDIGYDRLNEMVHPCLLPRVHVEASESRECPTTIHDNAHLWCSRARAINFAP
jgi:hypothetical protein